MHHKITLLFTICFILLKINFYGQDYGVIKGRVKDKGDVLPGAIISLGPKIGASTDINGDYILSVSSGTYALECTMIGYKAQKQTITVVAGDTLKLNFTLVGALRQRL